jgi:hypothetical protein
MTDHRLSTAKPSHALTMWVDDTAIYVEIPATNGGYPYIQHFPLHEAGLSKALNFLRTRYESAPTAEKNYTRAPVEPGYVCESAGASVVYRRQKGVKQTDVERAQAVAVLRKLGIV